MYKLYQKLLTTWYENNSFTRILVLFASVMMFLSIIMWLMNTVSNNQKRILNSSMSEMSNSLEIIETFDAKFPGKWFHFLTEQPKSAEIEQYLIQFQLDNIEVKTNNGIHQITGQTTSVAELTNAIDHLYNNHGLVIHSIVIDQIDQQTIFELSLTY
jgi:hypothetical protein